jgi:hypothetical protein
MFNVSQGGSNGIYGDGGSVYGGVNTKAVVTQDGEILTTESERELNAYA